MTFWKIFYCALNCIILVSLSFFFFPHIWNLELSARIWGCLKCILRFICCCCLSFLHPGVTSHPFKHNWWFFIVSKASSPFTFWPRSFSCGISFSCPQYALSFIDILLVSFSQPTSLVYLFAFLSPPLPGKPFGNVGYLRTSPSPKAASSLKLLTSLPQLKWCSMLSEPVLCTQAIGFKKKILYLINHSIFPKATIFRALCWPLCRGMVMNIKERQAKCQERRVWWYSS